MPDESKSLLERYKSVRRFSEKICETMETEDYVIQSMPDASPAKWHLAHTSWFFETFILSERAKNYKPLNPDYRYLFNSYYIQLGKRHARTERGFISRPTVREVYRYRSHVDESMSGFLDSAPAADIEEILPLIEIGIHHEQQHQELMLTDIKHALSVNPLRPALFPSNKSASQVSDIPSLSWIEFGEGIHSMGHAGDGFGFDNEFPRHRVFVQDFELASRLATCAEYMEFIEDGGYERAELWLSDGWAAVQANGWSAPMYWENAGGGAWEHFTLSGMRRVNAAEPVCHISHYEANAFARWAGGRLPTEAEWEMAAARLATEGNFAESGNYHPAGLMGSGTGLRQMFGDVWEWTESAYLPYPGYKPVAGALGEYNGKFMSGQMTLRGGSCATPASHIRATYRNFFPPSARWQFMGARLAR
ncbi:MAG: ergothioneine biosynthesis protein EgtB [Deltaproteobacteria bacterium]